MSMYSEQMQSGEEMISVKEMKEEVRDMQKSLDSEKQMKELLLQYVFWYLIYIQL